MYVGTGAGTGVGRTGTGGFTPPAPGQRTPPDRWCQSCPSLRNSRRVSQCAQTALLTGAPVASDTENQDMSDCDCELLQAADVLRHRTQIARYVELAEGRCECGVLP